MAETSIPKFTSAMAELVDCEFLRQPKYSEQQMYRAVREGAHEKILLFEKKFITRARKLGIPLYAHNMVRTAEQQDALFAKGVSRAKAGLSPHNFGLAVDIVHGVHHWELSHDAWRLLSHIGHEVAAQNGIKIENGLKWDFFDPAHWELKDWRSLRPA